MTAVVLISVAAGIGLVGVGFGFRSASPPLDAVWASWNRPAGPDLPAPSGWSAVDQVAVGAVRQLTDGRWAETPRARALRGALAVTGIEPTLFAARVVVIAVGCGIAPIVLWLALQVLGTSVPLAPAVIASCFGPVAGVALACASLTRSARERRRHVRVVLGSFVDLVVLGLAGGMGIDGALHAASHATPDWVARRIAHALRAARDGGTPPWEALSDLGTALGVEELVELSTTVQLAGTEGARIRQALVARAASLRRHEQADAESAANAMTERLFLPGALLLLGFLLFIGYPAVHRILGGL